MSKIRVALSRIYNDRKELGKITQGDIAKRLGCNRSTVSQYLNGYISMSEDVIEGFCDALGVKLADLENWNPTLAAVSTQADASEPKELREAIYAMKHLYAANSHAFKSASRAVDDWLRIVDRISSDAPKIKDPLAEYSDFSRPVPPPLVRYYNYIPAGAPLEVYPETNLWIEIDRDKVEDHWYALRVSGDSMSPKYQDGDIVLLDANREPRNGRVVAALIDGAESTLKTYYLEGNEITLKPVNPEHATRTYYAGRVTVQGVVIDTVRRKE